MRARELIQEAGITPDKSRDQYFLVDDDVLDRIAGYAPIGDRVLEIGAGVGNLTERLIEKYEDVVVVEIDPSLADFVENRFQDITVVRGDFLENPVPEFDVCVSNLPYSASSPILFRLVPLGKPLVLTLQKEFAERLVAGVGEDDYGRLSVTAGYFADANYLETVSRTAFEPQPEVDSAVVELTPTEQRVEDEELFMDLLRGVFTQRRKTLRNALRNTEHITGLDPGLVEERLTDDLLSKRPEEVSPDEYAKIVGRVCNE